MTAVLVPPADGRRMVHDVRSLADGERFDAWTDAVSSSFVPLAAESDGPDLRRRFTGSLVSQALGSALVTTVSGSAVTVARTPRQIASADPGFVKLGLQLHGRGVISQDGRTSAIDPGDFALYDTTRPYRLSFAGDFRQFVVMFPIDALPIDRDRLARVTAQRFAGGAGLAAIESSLLGAVSRQLDTGPLPAGQSLSDAVFDVLGAALAERSGSGDDAAGRRALRARIEAYIAAHIGDPELTVARIASVHHVSVRLLQKMFEEREETVSGWIRRRRLEAGRRQLAAGDAPVSMIAARWGFRDAASFTRAFRREYGVAPRDYRAAVDR